MKAKELMIGDWVMINPISYYQVEQIRMEFGELRIYLKGTEVFATENEIMPIPLTPEILEKNGFEKCEGNEFSFYKKEEERALYQVLWSAEELYLEIAPYTSKNGEFNRMGVEFVHELQHALRLCGIDKEIEL